MLIRSRSPPEFIAGGSSYSGLCQFQTPQIVAMRMRTCARVSLSESAHKSVFVPLIQTTVERLSRSAGLAYAKDGRDQQSSAYGAAAQGQPQTSSRPPAMSHNAFTKAGDLFCTFPARVDSANFTRVGGEIGCTDHGTHVESLRGNP
jgi:hypothetical protein